MSVYYFVYASHTEWLRLEGTVGHLTLPPTHTHTLKQGQLQQVAQDGVQKYSMVLSFKSIKCKTLHKIIILSQVSILELSSDKTSIITFHFSVYLGSRTIIKQFKYEDISSFTVAYGLGTFQRTAMIC